MHIKKRLYGINKSIYLNLIYLLQYSSTHLKLTARLYAFVANVPGARRKLHPATPDQMCVHHKPSQYTEVKEQVLISQWIIRNH